MEIRQLRTFVDVAANGSYARTAAIAGIAQSALSRQISALERGIGGRLFHRTGRGVVLTELGERMLPRARALVADAAAWQDDARHERAQPHGEVTLGVVPVASRGLIASIVAELRQLYPGIRLRVLEAYSGQVEEWLASGRVEIAIYNRYRRGRVANAEPLARANVHLIARRDHPMARRRELSVRSFAEIALAMPVRPNSLTSVLTGLAASQHFEIDIRLEAGSTPLIRDVMLASDLATISPRHVFTREIASGELVAIPIVRPKIVQTTWMSLSSHHPPSGAAEIVARLIRQLAARQRTAK
jgi:LysR family nitrogen assimilation transcriptional regulator